MPGKKLSEDCQKYGGENTCTSGSILSKASLSYGNARSQIEKERMNLMKTLGTQVFFLVHFTFLFCFVLSIYLFRSSFD